MKHKSGSRHEAETPQHAPCGCGATHDEALNTAARNTEPRRAVSVSPDIKTRNMNRLRRIEGQVRGVQKMVTDERYCVDIMTQIASIQEALRSVSRELMRNHLQHCVTAAVRSGGQDVDAVYAELTELMDRHGR